EEGLLYCAGKESFYLKMLAQYASSYDEKAKDLQDYRGSGDLNAYRVAVHALKSTSKTIGAKKLSAQAKALEEAARDGDEGFIEIQHPVLMEEYSRLADCLKNLEKLI
ncbi:MAG: Hpt domain-containing protein, partial [Lachnospiraceae bacterium]|nr:Hpt domain-containing protein [Lachnospiraceae bacterium]